MRCHIASGHDDAESRARTSRFVLFFLASDDVNDSFHVNKATGWVFFLLYFVRDILLSYRLDQPGFVLTVNITGLRSFFLYLCSEGSTPRLCCGLLKLEADLSQFPFDCSSDFTVLRKPVC